MQGCEPVPGARLALLTERVGFGQDVTGGANGCLYHVTNDNNSGPGSLREAAETGNYWIIFDDDFTIPLDSNIYLASNTTIDGRGRDVEVTGGGLHLWGPGRNVIIESISIRHVAGDNDLLLVREGATEFWFDHLTLADAGDEYIDISKAIEGVPLVGTISWSRFERGGPINDNELTILIGDDTGVGANDLIRVTLHHNLFDGTRQRHPLVNGATVHLFNNVIRWRLWGIQVTSSPGESGAQVVSERDIFDAITSEEENPDDGVALWQDGHRIRVTDPLLLNGAGIREVDPERAFAPGSFYSYYLDSTDGLLERVTAASGSGN